MSKNRICEQKRLADNWSGAKFARLMRPFVGVQTMYVDLNETLQIKEESP